VGEVCIQGPSVTPGEEKGREGREDDEDDEEDRQGREGDGMGGKEIEAFVL